MHNNPRASILNIEIPKKWDIDQTLNGYVNSFTFHGLTRLLTGYKVEKLIWFLCLATGITFATRYTYFNAMKYLHHGIYTSVQVTYTNKIYFPSVTFCEKNLFYEAYTSFCGKPLEQASSEPTWCGKEMKTWPSVKIRNETRNDSMTSWSNGLFTVSECVVDRGNSCGRVKSRNFKSLKMLNHSCITWNPRGDIDKHKYGLGLISLKFQPPQWMQHNPEIVAVVHSPGDFFDYTKVMVGTAVSTIQQRVTTKQIQHKRLPFPFPSNCQRSQFPNLVKYFPRYSRGLCMHIAEAKNILRKCGNALDFYKHMLSKSDIEIYTRNQTREEFLSCYNKIHASNNASCPPSCQEVELETRIENIQDTFAGASYEENEYRVAIKLKDTDAISTVEEKEQYTWYEMTSEVGGLVGLLMGASVLSFVEIGMALMLMLLKRIRSY